MKLYIKQCFKRCDQRRYQKWIKKIFYYELVKGKVVKLQRIYQKVLELNDDSILY
jgi:hypothetical protein